MLALLASKARTADALRAFTCFTTDALLSTHSSRTAHAMLALLLMYYYYYAMRAFTCFTTDALLYSGRRQRRGRAGRGYCFTFLVFTCFTDVLLTQGADSEGAVPVGCGYSAHVPPHTSAAVEAELERCLEVLEGRLVSSLLPAVLEDPQVDTSSLWPHILVASGRIH